MPDPLTLSCACADDDDVAVCELVELWWEGTSGYTSKNGIVAGNGITLYNGASVVAGFSDTGNGDFAQSLDLSVAADWDNLFVRVSIDASLNQPPVAGGAAVFELSWWIRAVFSCARPGSSESARYEMRLYEKGVVNEYNWVTEPTVLRSYLHGANSAALAVLYQSGSLLPTNGVSGDFGDFDTLPEGTIDLSSSGTAVCLCAEGGAAPYFYASLNLLPEGLMLNPLTGCITGSRTDKGATRVITFQVSDGNRDLAQVTCSFLAMCGGDGAIGNGFF
jgi:hypothetical protein